MGSRLAYKRFTLLSIGLLAIHSNLVNAISAGKQARLEILTALPLEALLDVNVEIVTGIEQSRAQAPSVTSVISAREIEAIGWNLALGVHNLFDKAAFEPSNGPDNDGVIAVPYDLPLAGRSIWAEARYAFK